MVCMRAVASDLRRLRWLATDFDSVEKLNRMPRPRTSVGGRQSHAYGRVGSASRLRAPPPALLLLGRLSEKPWLSGSRQQGLMALLAYSLHRPISGKAVHHALNRLLCPNVSPADVPQIAALPPCLRSALLARYRGMLIHPLPEKEKSSLWSPSSSS